MQDVTIFNRLLTVEQKKRRDEFTEHVLTRKSVIQRVGSFMHATFGRGTLMARSTLSALHGEGECYFKTSDNTETSARKSTK